MLHNILAKKGPLWPISIARILIGMLWLYSLRWKLPPDFVPQNSDLKGLMDWLHLEVEYPAFEWYATLVESVVIPNFILFAWLIFVAELFTGLSLLTGTWTRIGALIGLLMSINLGIGLLEVPGEWPWSYLMMVMWHGTFLVSDPGQLLGVDQFVRRRQET